MVRTNLKGVFCTYKTLKNGSRKTYWYHRATRRRLHGEPNSPEFIADYSVAEESSRNRLSYKDTFNGLIREYTLSVEFQSKLAPSTRKEYCRLLKMAEPEFGDLPIAALEDWRVRKDFLDWREKIARTSGSREADHRLSAISSMLTWGVARGRLPTNHLKGFKRLYHSTRSEIIWLPEHVEAFMKVAPLELQQAMLLALHTGQREGDLLRLPWTAYDGQTIRLRQAKARRGNKLGPIIEIPCTQALRRMLDGMERRSALILSTKSGRSYKKRYFIKTWGDAMKKVGLSKVRLPNIPDPVTLHFHDIRGTTITLLSEAGCTTPQIATITGHSLKTVNQILEHYLARTKGLAEQAIEFFENSPRTKFANRLQTVDADGTNKNKKNK